MTPDEAASTVQRIRAGELADPQLTFAAEDLADAADAALVVPCLLGVLAHPKSYVREGALYGLAGHLTDPRARDAIERAASHDESPVLRKIAADLLDDAL